MTKKYEATATRSIAGVAIFAGLPPKTLSSIEARCAWRSYEAGEPIVDYLDASNDVYFIVSGKARANIYSVQGKAVTFSDLQPGDAFGEYAAIDGEPRSVGVEARLTCLVASMSAAAFREVLATQPAVAMNLIRGLVAKVRALSTRIYEFSALAVNNRIQAELLRLAGLTDADGNTAELEPSPNHADIASRTGTHREAVTRELSRLAKLGVVERHGRSLLIKDVTRLSRMVSEATGE